MIYNLVNENFKSDYGANLLRSRGVDNIELFLNPDETCLQSWEDLDNIEQGVNLIKDTIYNEKPYGLIVDCDCDGFTSAATIYLYLKKLNSNKKIEYFIHSGKQHGLSDLYQDLIDKDYAALIIPDAGSNDSQYIKELNYPVLVMDHHILEDNSDFAKNLILINNQTSQKYKNKDLSGVGVTWQFCRALDDNFKVDYAKDFIDLAALGIDGDMMSMISLENRYIVKRGFENIKNFFFKVLTDKQSYSMGDKITPITVAFYIVPLINAMIRVGTMEEKERLFFAFINGEEKIPSQKRGAKGEMEYAAAESARECTNAKSRQDKLKEKVIEQLEVKIFKHDLLENQILFVRLDDEDVFPSELNGLVSMGLSAKYKKPTIVARRNGEGYIRGSARGINNSQLESFKDYLNSTELFEYTVGHKNAFGLSIHTNNLDELHLIANKDLASYDFGSKSYDVNFVRTAFDTDLCDLIYDLSRYEDTWGQMNNEAFIYIDGINITSKDFQIIGKNKDTVKFSRNGITYIKFHAKDLIEELSKYNDKISISIIGKPNLNDFMGNITPQILIEDYSIADGRLAF